MQALITDFVIDTPPLWTQGFFMLEHDEIRDELIARIADKSVKQADVARKLGIAPARVAEIRKGERRIQPHEMPNLARFLGLLNDSDGEQSKIKSVSLIRNLGKVAQGVWLQESESDEDVYSTVAYDRMEGDPSPVDLFAVTPEGTSMNKRFMPGTQLICRKVPFGVTDLKSGDYVVVARTKHELRELTCKRLEVLADGTYTLQSESNDKRFAEPWVIGKPDKNHHIDSEIGVIGKVIRAVQDFERGTPN